jgi:hypothetical protein
MSPSRVLLKQSRLFHLVLLPWDFDLWYVDSSLNKELVIFKWSAGKPGPLSVDILSTIYVEFRAITDT